MYVCVPCRWYWKSRQKYTIVWHLSSAKCVQRCRSCCLRMRLKKPANMGICMQNCAWRTVTAPSSKNSGKWEMTKNKRFGKILRSVWGVHFIILFFIICFLKYYSIKFCIIAHPFIYVHSWNSKKQSFLLQNFAKQVLNLMLENCLLLLHGFGLWHNFLYGINWNWTLAVVPLVVTWNVFAVIYNGLPHVGMIEFVRALLHTILLFAFIYIHIHKIQHSEKVFSGLCLRVTSIMHHYEVAYTLRFPSFGYIDWNLSNEMDWRWKQLYIINDTHLLVAIGQANLIGVGCGWWFVEIVLLLWWLLFQSINTLLPQKFVAY